MPDVSRAKSNLGFAQSGHCAGPDHNRMGLVASRTKEKFGDYTEAIYRTKPVSRCWGSTPRDTSRRPWNLNEFRDEVGADAVGLRELPGPQRATSPAPYSAPCASPETTIQSRGIRREQGGPLVLRQFPVARPDGCTRTSPTGGVCVGCLFLLFHLSRRADA